MLFKKFICSHRWSITLLVSWVTYLCALDQFNLWHLIGVPHIEPLFADLHAILSAAECHQRGFDVFVNNPCDALNRPHVYGSLWLTLSRFDSIASHLFNLGVLLNLAFISVVVWLVKPSSINELLSSALILFSPAVTLGIERANNDLVIFLLTFVSGLLLSSTRIISLVFGVLVIYIATLLKIYPVVLFGAVILLKKDNQKIIAIIGFVIVLAALWFVTNKAEILILRNLVPKPQDHYVTGASALYTYLVRALSEVQFFTVAEFSAIVTACIVASSAWLAKRLKNDGLSELKINFNYIAFVLGLSILSFTYVINTNYDYRWIFVILMLPLIFDIKRSPHTSRLTHSLTTLFFVCTLIVVWAEELRATQVWAISLKLTQFFSFYNYTLYMQTVGHRIPISLLQQCAREVAACVVFAIAFSFVIRISFKRRLSLS